MGFEQLAQLKEQLAAQARADKASQRSRAESSKPVKTSPPVDPIVLTIGRLQKLFPKAFPKSPAPKVPLKIGVHQDLLAQSQAIKIPEADLKEAIKTWCWGTRYWACIVEGAERVDLDGNAVGTVTANEASQARNLESRRNRQRSKKLAKNARLEDGPDSKI